MMKLARGDGVVEHAMPKPKLSQDLEMLAFLRRASDGGVARALPEPLMHLLQQLRSTERSAMREAGSEACLKDHQDNGSEGGPIKQV